MRILVVGSGGREHALAWKIARSPLVEKLWTAPGNPGTAEQGENVPIAATDLDGLVRFARENSVDLVVVGPEDPLTLGLVDRLLEHKIPAFGPNAAAAELEGSKAFAKELLVRHRIPTAAYRVYRDLNPALSYLDGGARYPVVVKASGLAAGKGVTICADNASARTAVKQLLEDRIHGDAGATVLIEEFLDGPEASAFAITDGKTIVPLEFCQDHKSLREGGEGPNTGGMGAISPNPVVSERMRDSIERQVLVPTVHAMNHEGKRFRGVIYAGLKVTPAGPKVLEYNVRFGDPEAQVLMMRMRSDIVPYLAATAAGTLEELEAPEFDLRPCVCVVLASGGYPGSYRKGLPITGIEDVARSDSLQVFEAGTSLEDGARVTSGGRVLAVTALGDSLSQARQAAYSAAEQIQFDGKVIRRDIGLAGVKALENVS